MAKQEKASDLIEAPQQLTPIMLSSLLRRAGVLPNGAVKTVELRQGYRSEISTCTHIDLSFTEEAPPDAPTTLFLKIAGLQTPQDQREPIFYQTTAPALLDPAFLSCYDAYYCPQRRAYHLLLPDISQTHILSPSWEDAEWFRSAYDARIAEQVVSGLAVFHAAHWGKSDPYPELDLSFDAADIHAYYAKFAANIEPFLEVLGGWVTTNDRALFSHLAECGPDLLGSRFGTGALTLTHGDPHSFNIAVPRDPQTHQGIILDWATYAQSFGPMDLATYLSLFWYPRPRRFVEASLLRHYHSKLLKEGVCDYPWAACWDDYRLGVLAQLLRRIRVPPLTDHASVWIFENCLAAFHELNCTELLV